MYVHSCAFLMQPEASLDTEAPDPQKINAYNPQWEKGLNKLLQL